MTATTSGARRFLRRAVTIHLVAGAVFVVGSALLFGAYGAGDVARALLFAGVALFALGAAAAGFRVPTASLHDNVVRAYVDSQTENDPTERAWRQRLTLLLWCAAALLVLETVAIWTATGLLT